MKFQDICKCLELEDFLIKASELYSPQMPNENTVLLIDFKKEKRKKNRISSYIPNRLEFKTDRFEDMKTDIDTTIIPTISLDQAYEEPPNECLLKTPYNLLIIAQKGSGKSTVLINLVEFYSGYFDELFIISPTLMNDDNWKEAFKSKRVPRPKPSNYFHKYDEKVLQQIWNDIQGMNDDEDMLYKDKLKTHFIFDDVVGEIPKGTRNSVILQMARTHRHLAVNSTIVSQEWITMDRTIRKNASGYIFFFSGNQKERDGIINEMGGFMGKYRFERMWNHCCSKPFGFLFINCDNTKIDGEPAYYSNFKERLNPSDFSNERIVDARAEVERLRELNPVDEKPQTPVVKPVVETPDTDSDNVCECEWEICQCQ